MPPFDQNPGYPTAILKMAHYEIIYSDFMVTFIAQKCTLKTLVARANPDQNFLCNRLWSVESNFGDKRPSHVTNGSMV